MSTTLTAPEQATLTKNGEKIVVSMSEQGVITPAGTRVLNHSDRCDRCGGRAYVRIKQSGKERLLLCGHHGRKNEAGLRMAGFDYEDQTFQLFVNTKPDASA